MKHGQQTRPLSGEADTPQEVRELLGWARTSGAPSEAQLQRLGARVAPVVGLPVAALGEATLPAVGTAPPAPGAAAGAATTTTSVPPAAGAGLAQGGGAAAGALKATGGSQLGALGLVKLGAAAAALVTAGAVTYAALQAPPPARPQGPPSSAVEPPGAPASPAEVTPPPAAPGQAAEVPRQDAVEPGSAVPGPAAPRPAAKAPPRRVEEPTRPAPPPSEIALMRQAEEQRSSPDALLPVLERHERLYPEGMLAQERDVLRIEALMKLDRRGEAERRAAAMEREHPGSPHLGRVRQLLTAD